MLQRMGGTLTAVLVMVAGAVMAGGLIETRASHAMGGLLEGVSVSMGSQGTSQGTPQADALFADHGADVLDIARRIERGEPISRAEIEALPNGANGRYGEDITLLFHAFGARDRRPNIAAIDTLLAAGADPYAFDRPEYRRRRRFVGYLTEPQHPFSISPVNEETLAERRAMLNEIIALYLKHGGDPDYPLGSYRDPMIADVAMVDNYEGFRLLLEAGGDPFEPGEKFGSAAERLVNGKPAGRDEFDRMIDEGYLDGIDQAKAKALLSALSSYSQRGDEESGMRQHLGRRVLKRIPDYPADEWTARLFKDHYDDPAPGVIPWDEIASDAVR